MAWTGLILFAVALLPTADPAGRRWQWPLLPPPKVLRGFDPPAHPWDAGHRGVDLAARPGEPVYAAGAGAVGFARDFAGRGVVTVVHGALRTTYLPVRPSVHIGQIVRAGARLGVVDDTLGHCGQSSCLHWGLRHGVAYLDPLTLLGGGPVRLLPWWRTHDRSGGEPPASAPAPPSPAAPSPARAPRREPSPHPADASYRAMRPAGAAVAGATALLGLAALIIRPARSPSRPRDYPPPQPGQTGRRPHSR